MPTDIDLSSARTLPDQVIRTLEEMRPLVWISVVPCIVILLLTHVFQSLADAVELAARF